MATKAATTSDPAKKVEDNKMEVEEEEVGFRSLFF